MACLIDTSVLIAYEQELLNVEALVRGREDEAFYLSVISASELLHGVHRAQDSNIRARRSAFVETVLSRFPMLEIDLIVARAHAGLWSRPAAKGQMIGVHDSWIAATCIAHDLRLITAIYGSSNACQACRQRVHLPPDDGSRSTEGSDFHCRD